MVSDIFSSVHVMKYFRFCVAVDIFKPLNHSLRFTLPDGVSHVGCLSIKGYLQFVSFVGLLVIDIVRVQ